MSQANNPQPQTGVLTDPNSFIEYLTYVINASPNELELSRAIAGVRHQVDELLQQHPDCDLSISIGLSDKAWTHIFPDKALPPELKVFEAMHQDGRCFPSTEGDLFFIIESIRKDINFEAAKAVHAGLKNNVTLVDDTQSYKYLDDRDMIGFVDGTENPEYQDRASKILVHEGLPYHQKGCYLTVQKYVHKAECWEQLSRQSQEQVVGRRKIDNVELGKEEKPIWAHNNKSKVEKDGVEVQMLRQNRPFGNLMEHGTMFVGMVQSAQTIETSLKQMIYADDQGAYDKLLDFVEAQTGTNYFMPSQTLLDGLDL